MEGPPAMTGLPWFKCYPRDFNDGMMTLTMEERGAYVTILNCIYQRGGPVGDDPLYFRAMLQCSGKAWSKVRAALIVKGRLFEVSLNGKPCLMDERAAEEIEKNLEMRRELSERGARGGRKSQAKAKENNTVEKAPAQAEVEPGSSDTEAESETERKDGEAIASLVQAFAVAVETAVASMRQEAKRAFDQRFATFWAAYPRRVKKPDALRAYTKAEERIGDDALAVILAGIERALPGWDDPKFIPHPATWLNACQWEDEPPQPRTGLTRNDRPSPDRKYDAKQANYDASWAGADRADQVLVDRRNF
jgi:uncharacterized protein YdaU (DUF1376 family)